MAWRRSGFTLDGQSAVFPGGVVTLVPRQDVTVEPTIPVPATGASPALRAEATEELLRAGDRALQIDGNLRASRTWYDAAYDSAERAGDAHALARAAIGLGGLWLHEHRSAPTSAMVEARQRRALRMVDPTSTVALRLRARLAAEDDYRTGGHAAILAVVEEAAAGDDPLTHAEALSLAHHCVLGPDHGPLRHRLARDLLAEASRTQRRSDLLMGLVWQTVDCFLDGDRHAERRLRELRDLLGGHQAVGFIVRSMEVMLDIRAGRFDRAEAAAAECAEFGAESGDIDAAGWHGAQLVAIRWYQGRVAELDPMLSQLAHSPTLSAADNSFFAAQAIAAAAAGDTRRAAAALARIRDLADLPRSSSWLVALYGVVEAAHLLADADTARRAQDLLLPHAGRPMMASLGVACFGSVRHALGMAALTTRDLDAAIGHFRAAVEKNLAVEHWPAVTVSRWRLGRALADRDGPGDADASAVECALAVTEAARLGMRLPGQPESRATARPQPDSATLVCRRQGRTWVVELGRRGVTVEHSVGLAHLAVLVANPGREIRAADLAAGTWSTDAVPGLSAQARLDSVAIRDYRRRVSELESEIEELTAANDVERVARLRADRDWLVAELVRETGVGGVVRQFADDEERARVAVGKAIRRAVNRVADADPVLGAHLRATVHTGARCYYRQ
jgi:hypothetical protein